MEYLHCKHLAPRWSILAVCCALAILADTVPTWAAVNVTQHHNHLSRDGLYIDPAFTTAHAAGLTRVTTFNGVIIGNVYAQPLYTEGGPLGRPVIIALTQ